MRKTSVAAALLFLVVLVGSAGAALGPDEQIKKLAERYNQVEGQLDRSVHYLRKEVSDVETSIEQAWFDGAGDLIKVATEKSDASGRELTEYVALNFDDVWDGMFLLTRKETPLPDGGVQVDESRQYFGATPPRKDGTGSGNGELIRELRKSARFEPGETLDTTRFPNTTVALQPPSSDTSTDEERSKARAKILSTPQEIATAVREAGPPESDPFAPVQGDAEKFRVIHGTVSPDGRDAIALGFARTEIDWDAVVDPNYPELGRTYNAEDDEDVRNYVVDLQSQRILGETGCKYFGTRRRYNHRECRVSWSPDCTTFVELWDNKWSSEECCAGKIGPGPKLLATVDLARAAADKTWGARRKHRDPDSEGGLSLGIDSVNNQGIVEMQVFSVDPTVPHRGETIFAYRERFRLRAAGDKLRAELVSMRKIQEPD